MQLEERIRQAIRKLAIEIHGIHIVATWEGSGSDALDLDIYTKEKLLKEFPDTDPIDAEAFFNGEKEGILIATWTDYRSNQKVEDHAWYPMFHEEEDKILLETMEETVTMHFKTVILNDLPRLEKRLQSMPKKELHLLINALDSPLSSLDTGEGQAFKFLAKIEQLAIKELKQ